MMLRTQSRTIASMGLGALVILAWVWTIHLAGTMRPVPVAMPGMNMWTVSDLFALWMMWSVMMVAMMLPSVSPTILTYAAMEKRNSNEAIATVRAGLFLTGYVAAWTAFCVFAVGAQWALHSAALLSPMMISTSARFSGFILLLAGIFQWSPTKHKCLSQCRSPIGFLLTEWRHGPLGAVVMGVKHGSYCVACCWLLMALFFVAGVMNLLWVAVLSIVVLIEKVYSNGEQFAKFEGILLLAWGAWLLT